MTLHLNKIAFLMRSAELHRSLALGVRIKVATSHWEFMPQP